MYNNALIPMSASYQPVDNYGRRFASKPHLSDLPDADTIYQLLGITAEEAVEGDIRMLEEKPDDNLVLVHYLNLIPAVYHIRGVIIDTAAKKVVAASFPYTREVDEIDDIEIPFSKEKSVVTKAYEGTILRVFKSSSSDSRPGSWYISTHKRIDGRRSRWMGPPFGQTFEEVWGTQEEFPFDDYLVEGWCYTFLISHPESRLVCHIPEPSVTLVGIFESAEDGSMKISDKHNLEKEHPRIAISEPLVIENLQELLELAGEIDWQECTGLLVTTTEDDGSIDCVKIVPPGYVEKRMLRGGEPSLRLRYLSLMLEPEEVGGREELLELLPEKKEYFDQVLSDYNRLTPYLSEFYHYRYRQRNFLQLPQEEHIILENTRRHYDRRQSLAANLVDHLESYPPRKINAMIRHMREEERQAAIAAAAEETDEVIEE